MRLLRVDGDRLLRDLDALAKIGSDDRGGVSRIAFSNADREARTRIDAEMKTLGMHVVTDAAGNTIGTYAPQDSQQRPIALGSHTDSVPQGGRYDGALGVVAALACVRALQQGDVGLRHPVEVINFAAEEATMGGTLGSRAMAGILESSVLESAAWDGQPILNHLRAAGLDPAAIMQAARPVGSIAAYFELHVEQGGVLEAAGVPLGVVEGIVGIRRYAVSFQGHANHAGTTPMAGRRDALVMAVPFITAVRDIATTHGIVGTVGTLRLQPNSPNVIPGRVDLEVEIRGLDEAVLDEVEEKLVHLAELAAGKCIRTSRKPPVMSEPRLLSVLEEACAELNVGCMRMKSGAGHDMMCIATIAPAAMLFVPSRGGISHSPDEFTDAADCITGANALLSTLMKLDAAL